jgi:hypothetical protein
MRAWPDDARVLDAVTVALADFAARTDLRRHREQLADSGIAGTAIHYHFFWPMARWLAARWPTLLHFDRDCGEGEDWLRTAWPVALPWIHAEAAKRSEQSPFRILDSLRGSMTDASFFVQGIDHTAGDTLARESLHDAIQPAYVLEPNKGDPICARNCCARQNRLQLPHPAMLPNCSISPAVRWSPAAAISMPSPGAMWRTSTSSRTATDWPSLSSASFRNGACHWQRYTDS